VADVPLVTPQVGALRGAVRALAAAIGFALEVDGQHVVVHAMFGADWRDTWNEE